MPGPFKSLGAHGRGSNMRIKPEHWVYSIMERPRIIYKIIKIIQYIVLIILLFYVILYRNSATNLQYNLLHETMTFHVQFIKCHTIMSAYHVTCGKVK